MMLDTQTQTRSMLSEAAAAFIYRKHGLFIGGEWTDSFSAQEMEVIDPATGALLTHCALSDTKDVDRAVASARKALEGLWSKMTGIERGKLISRFANRLEELAEELAEIEAIDCGRPITYARHVDIPLTINTYRYMAGWAGKVNGETVEVAAPGEYHAFTIREPVGVVAQIVPWNFPLVLTAYKLAPSLAAGCTAIIKPSEQASLSLLRLAEVAEEVGFPPGVINVVTGYGDTVGAALAAHPDVDKVAFTGSARVGRLIAQSATSNLKRVTLELGGKAPMIVLPDADLEKVIPSIASAAFFYQGQVCTSGSRLYVHKSIHDQVLDGVREEATKLKMGHSLSADTTLGPLISLNQLERVSRYVDLGRLEGADIVCGGKSVNSAGYYFEPTILINTTDNMTVAREEIFGPVLCAMSFNSEDLDDIARRANDSPSGLCASIWTRNLSSAHKLAQRIKAGSVWINLHHYFDPALPFGGYKESGWGREQGAEALRTFTEVKSICAAL
jgi:phenylacetaldehyde dehydrogenase